jgi:acetyl-CoA/propionyl-CoA carboxylase carboxyl transferase subunit
MSGDGEESVQESEAVRELRERRERAHRGGGLDRIERQHDRGKLTARERIDYLLDDGTFREVGAFVEHQCTNFGMEDRTAPGDAVVGGYGEIDGRPTAVYAHDFTFLGGSVGSAVADKVCTVVDWAIDNRIPVVGLNDSAGARIQEGVDALDGFSRVFAKHTAASGVVPQVSVIMGPCAGGATYAPALTDFVFMVEDTSNAFITGPDVVETVTGEDVTKAELGGATAHSTKSGVAHATGPADEAVLDTVRRLLSYLPASAHEAPPAVAADDDPTRRTSGLEVIVPTESVKPYDVREVIGTIVDMDSFFEVRASWARNLVTGFARLDGYPLGVVANQPRMTAGTLDVEAAQKGARFVRFCDAFNVPILTLVDTPGFMPGSEQEHRGIIRHGAKLIHAYAEATVPLLTLVTRKAYGGAYIVMASKSLGADVNYALPEAEMAVLGPKPAVRILYGDEIEAADDPERRRQELIEEYRTSFANPYEPAKRGHLDDVVEPGTVRSRLVDDLSVLVRDAGDRGPKHGNIPL